MKYAQTMQREVYKKYITPAAYTYAAEVINKTNFIKTVSLNGHFLQIIGND